MRDDGLWDVEAELTDTKARDFQLATGMRRAGDPIHHMRLTITIDMRLNVTDAHVKMASVPYPGYCEAIEAGYRQLIGLNLLKDFRRSVRERLGGSRGCTHLTELTDLLPTAAMQALAGEVYPTRDASQDVAPAAALERKPFQLDRCHALRSDGPAAAEFYPRWFVRSATTKENI